MADENVNEIEISTPEGDGISFTISDENGNEIECKVLYFFHSDYNDKHYMVYTTGVVGPEGDEVSAVRYNPEELARKANGEDVEVLLEPLTEDIEWAIVADTLKQVVPEGTEVDGTSVVSDDVILERAPEN